MREKVVNGKKYWDPKEYPKELREKAKKLKQYGEVGDKVMIRIDKKTTIFVTQEKYNRIYKSKYNESNEKPI